MLLQLLLLLAAGYGALVAVAYFAQEKLIYFPEVGRELRATPRDRGLPHEELTLRTDDGLGLHAWYVPVPEARGVVLFFHGNAGNLSHRLDSLVMFARLGYATLIVDYRGYGRSEGEPSEEGTYRDALAAWHYLTAERGIAPGDVVLFGESLGAAVAAWLAARTRPRALVILSGFVSVPELGQDVYPWLPVKWLARIRYPTQDYLKAATCPVLVAHSRDDEIVPFRHGERLYAAASAPKRFLELKGGHNEAFFFVRPEWEHALGEFLNWAQGQR
ncbi:alpha/beta hydrolase [Pelomicrobium sp.]|jgi:fermentation-respiration switch protein FrsA (DUF1100 family)|uniref:alpha/beta hydrolase n=1 Tax=Pelomicrobium sp. TaxID=2815319 RepID=UPI002FDE8FE9